MKYYRMKNPNWDGKNPAYQWRIAVTIEENGVEKFVTLTTTNGQRHVDTMPVTDCVIVPSKFQLDRHAFHLLRNYIECLGVANMEAVTEEQIKAEETIDMNSGFDWLYEDSKESLRPDPSTGKSSTPRPPITTLSSPGNPFSISKSNIFGTGLDKGTLTSRTPTLSPSTGHTNSIGYFPGETAKSAEEMMAELLEVKTKLELTNPKGNK